MSASKNRTSITQRELKPKDIGLLILVFILLWLAYLYLPTLWRRATNKARLIRGDIITFQHDSPSPPKALRPGGAWASPLSSSSDGGQQSKGRGGRPVRLLWQNETPLAFPFSPAVGPNGRILIACQKSGGSIDTQRFFAFNPEGTIRWQMPLEKGCASHYWLENGNALLAGETQQDVVSNDTTNSVMMVDPDGKILWQWHQSTPAGGVQDPLHVTPNGQIVLGNLGGSQGTGLISWRSDGEMLWRTPDPAKSNLSGIASSTQGRIFAVCQSSSGDSLHCLNKEGKLVWKVAEPHFVSRVVVGADGNLRFVVREGAGSVLLCLNAEGRELWRTSRLPIGGPYNSDIALSLDGRTLVRGEGGMVCINKSGTTLWMEAIPPDKYRGAYGNGSLAVSVDGYVYVNRITQIDTLSPDGRLIDTLTLPNQIITGMAVGDQRLYLTLIPSSSTAKGSLAAYELQE